MRCGTLRSRCTRPFWAVAMAIALAVSACATGPQTTAVPATPQPPAAVATQPVIPRAALPCASLDEFKNTWTPEDSFSRMQDCIGKGDAAKASDLDTMAVIYGDYDMWRVNDEDVKNGFAVLTYLTYQDLNDSQRHDLSMMSTRKTVPGSTSAKALCQKVLRIGPPAYLPLYMTKYRVDDGGRSVMVPQVDQVDLSPVFDPVRQWKEAVDAVLHCGKQ